MSFSPPDTVTAGSAVTVSGRAPGAPGGAQALLERERSPGAWVLLVGAPIRHGRFSLSWRPAAAGPVSLRVAVRRRGRRLALSGTARVLVGSPPEYCAEAPTPADVPPGDGWLEGGMYIAGGPAPGIFACERVSYGASVLDQAGAVVAVRAVLADQSYVFVLPPGLYSVQTGSCGGSGAVTVTAGRGVKANVVCNVP